MWTWFSLTKGLYIVKWSAGKIWITTEGTCKGCIEKESIPKSIWTGYISEKSWTRGVWTGSSFKDGYPE